MDKSNEGISNDRALSLLELLQYDYADGRGDHGPVLSEFSGILSRYHANYCAWRPYIDDSNAQKFRVEDVDLKLMLIASGVIFAVHLLLFQLLHAELLLRIIYYIAGGIALGIVSEQVAWGIFFVCLPGTLSFVTGDNQFIVILAFLALYLLYGLIKKSKVKGSYSKIDKEQEARLKAYETHEMYLDADREKLNDLLPRLRAEFAQMRKQLVEELGAALSPDEKENYAAQLPKNFWWQISPKALEHLEYETKAQTTDSQDLDSEAVWETRWVQRNLNDAFALAGEEYSPLYPIFDNDNRLSSQIYNAQREVICEKQLGCILDFISRGTSSTMESNTIQYQDYKYSDSTKSDVDFLMFLAANSIDKAYKNNEVSDEQYADNVETFAMTMGYLDEKMNEKVTRERTEYHQIKTHTNIWTGQILLSSDNEQPDGYAIIDYRCRLFQTFKNLDSLRDIKITRVYGDVMHRNPIVLAKIHKICPACR